MGPGPGALLPLPPPQEEISTEHEPLRVRLSERFIGGSTKLLAGDSKA